MSIGPMSCSKAMEKRWLVEYPFFWDKSKDPNVLVNHIYNPKILVGIYQGIYILGFVLIPSILVGIPGVLAYMSQWFSIIALRLVGWCEFSEFSSNDRQKSLAIQWYILIHHRKSPYIYIHVCIGISPSKFTVKPCKTHGFPLDIFRFSLSLRQSSSGSKPMKSWGRCRGKEAGRHVGGNPHVMGVIRV